ncbi:MULTISPECIES: GNAT family N-acetyltransferase [unclassified Lentilitoribacter]|uniref:GNAT family N-acetyltransferase n=1 Tax=unclassified Lentilitoribacter TaxID=2647570 RepID=UPI0013A6D8FF|nr:GNAT family N-acetyltransferase [Lentilitoribacter sp. Alg239-R112]
MLKHAIVRRLEALAFRAWPAASTFYDGSWLIRQTAGHPSKRLNSVNPLDPSDHHQIEERIERATRRFESYNRPLVFRQSPLAPPQLDSFLDARGWVRFDESIVLMVDIDAINLDDAVDMVPVQDVGLYVDAAVKIRERDRDFKAGLTEIVTSIKPKTGFFLLKDEEGGVVSSALCVHDDEYAGLLDVGTSKQCQRAGHARAILKSAILWARYNGSKRVWLQVEKANAPARALYDQIGFKEIYRYSYRKQPDHAL